MFLDELREVLERHVRPDLTTAIEGVRICKAGHTVSPESSMSGTVLAVIAQGGKRLALGDRVYEYGAGQYLVASVDLPLTGHVIDAVPGLPTLSFGMTLEPAAIAELLLQAGPGDLPRPPAPHARESRSASPRTSCSTPSCGCCACSTGHGTGRH
jgi:hypothetical protein